MATSLEKALSLHRSGFLPEAESLYREVLKRSPRHADALNLLGVLCLQRGDPASAAEWIGKAVKIDPRNAEYQFNFGKALLRLKRLRDACRALESAIALRADHADAHNELGLAQMEMEEPEAAAAAFRAAISLQPDYFEPHNNLGMALHFQGKNEEADASLRRALELDPRSARAWSNLGMVQRAQDRAAQAEESYRRAIALSPKDPAILTNLGTVLIQLARHEEAIACFREALAIAPDYADAHYNWGTVHARDRQYKLAMEKFSDTLARNPVFFDALSGLCSALHNLGHVEEAIPISRRALQLRPDDRELHSHLLFALLHSPASTPEELFAEHSAWAHSHVAGLVPRAAAHRNSPEPERRLRVGYVSGDFRIHSVAYFIEPVLEHHDRGAFEIFCYSNSTFRDAATERLRGHADCWREVFALDDEAMAGLVRDDAIDILVDLSGHMRFNRLLAFARKPAPVQVTWLGYPGTTGLDAIDYRLTDVIADPAGAEAHACEKLIRLPHGFLCYRPPPDAPSVGAPPSSSAGYLTFGSFNTLAKVNPAVIALWARILAAVPRSRLMIKANQTVDPDNVAHWRERFVAHGIAADRLDLAPATPSLAEHLTAYHEVDIMLDPFPYNGTTMTCEALWMGVPVVTLEGGYHAGRVGASLLAQVDLDELIARTLDSYAAAAVALARDPGRLAALRAGLRARMAASPLTDAAGFSRALEAAYRAMWRRWCEDGCEGIHVS